MSTFFVLFTWQKGHKSISFSHAKNPGKVSTSSLPHMHGKSEKQAAREHIVDEENDFFNLHFICFTFYSKYKAQTLAIVPLEIVPQGRNISLDKHLEEEAWQDASPQKFQSRLSVCAASQQPPFSAGI